MTDLKRPETDLATAVSELRANLPQIATAWRQTANEIADAIKAISTRFSEVVSSLNAIGPELASTLRQAFQNLPERTKQALLALGEAGWYLDPEMPAFSIYPLEESLRSHSTENVNDVLARYFQRRLPDIRSSLTGTFRHRAKVLDAAFEAHLRGEYDLAIPVFLAQADGIARELRAVEIFTGKTSADSVTAESYANLFAADAIWAAYLAPLGARLPLSVSKKQRPPSFSGLNRHAVLHGESWDYGTEVNSLKAVSFLNYVAYILQHEEPTRP